jgi:ubiquinone biosynthesis protein
MPQLVHGYLAQATSGTMELRIASDDLKTLESSVRRGQRVAIWLSLGVSLAVASMLVALLGQAGAPFAVGAWLAGVGALAAFALAARAS